MNITNTIPSPAPALVKNSWNFLEAWIDPMQSPPYLLLLLGNKNGSCHILNPAEDYKIVKSCKNYEEAQLWLLEDEYEPLEGRISSTETYSEE